MNKRVLHFLLVLCSVALIFSLAGCKEKKAPATEPAASTEAVLPEDDNNTVPTDAATIPTEPQGEMGVTSREEFDREETKPEDTKPEDTKPEDTKPEQSEGPAEEPDAEVPPAQTKDPSQVTYAQFMAMTDEEEEAFVESFPTLRDFNNWRIEALKKEPDRDKELLDGNEIDLSKP